jgi:NAD(P)H dehydrogenase (quinone)
VTLPAPPAKVLVLYDSRTGPGEQTAKLIAEGASEIQGVEVRTPKTAADGPDTATTDDVLRADGVAVDSPTNMAVLSWRMKKFWDAEMAPHWMNLAGKFGSAFNSADGWGGGTELACQSILTVPTNTGFVFFGVTDYVSGSRDGTLDHGAVSAKAPKEEQARASCRVPGRRLAEWTATCVRGIRTEHPGLKLAQRRPPHG